MNKEDFFERFIKLLENTRELYELNNVHDALIVWFSENFLLLDPIDVKERIVTDKRAEGIDAVLVDRTNYSLIFMQTKTVDSFSTTLKNFPENDLKLTLEGMRLLLRDYKGKITPELENLVDEYHEYDKTGDYSTKVLFIVLKKGLNDNKFIKNFNEDFPQIEINIIDFDKLHYLYENQYLLLKDPPPEKISFEIITNLLKKDAPIKARVFTCKGKELAKIYNDYRERIFQQNVRYSLGLKSRSINRQILETAVDSSRSGNFWYFNNGITIVCNEINETNSGRIINLKNAQIINGAQTTYALHEAYINGDLNDEVEVLIKAIESGEKDFIENVTLYTNSQNAIRLRDLCSNDEVQLKIQTVLQSTYKYFYERKRGELESLYPTLDAKKKFLGDNFKAKVISNENAAQSILAMYLDMPSQAKAEKGRIFVKDTGGFYDDIFDKHDDLLSEKILLSWKLLKYIELKKSNYAQQYKQAEDLSEIQMDEIYKYDFILHSEYFILNIFGDFIKNREFDIESNQQNIVDVINMIDNNDSVIAKIYETIKNALFEFIDTQRSIPGYYHNKFFKSERSIGLVRNFMKETFGFIEVL